MVGLCLHLLQFEDTREKLADVTSSIITSINSRCQCSLTVNHISTASFLCTSERQVVLYRAILSGHPDCAQVLSYIQQWASGGQMYILVQGNSIEVYSNCPIEVDSLTAQANCSTSSPENHSSTSSPENHSSTSSPENHIGAIGGGVGGVVLIIVAVVVTCVCVCRYKKKQR